MAVIARYSAKEHVKGPLRSILFTALTLAIPYAEKATAQVYINDGLDGACQRIVDTGGSSIEAKVSSQCNEDPWNVTLYTRFFGSSTAAGDQGGASRSLVLGGVLYVNGGQVGINDVLNKTYSLRMGSVATMNAAVGANAIAIGSSQSSAADATKASLATQASGARAIAIGAKTTASAVDAVAVGSGATANTGSFSVAIGANTSAVNGGVAVGGGSLVTVTDGAVALGLNSVASTGKGLAGYDPGTKTTSTDVSATWKSTLSAVSIGDVSGTTIKTRQLSGLAAGTSMTDAVNVAQLKVVDEIASKGWNLTASGVNSGKVAPGSSVDLKNTDKNLTITKAIGSNDVAFNLAKDVKIGTLTVGNTLLNTDGMAFGSNVTLDEIGLAIANGPSVTGSGIDAGGKVISHVAAGEVSATSTEAVNGSQLSAVQAQANQPMTFTGNEGSVARTLGQTLVISGESSTAGSYSGANLKSVVDAATGTLHLQLAESPQFGKVQINDGGKISGVAPGTAETDVPNMGQLKSISETVDKGWNLTASGANTSKVAAGATVDLKNTDGNLTISKTSDSNDVVFNLSKDFKVDGVTAGTTVVNNDGVQVGSDVALGKTGLTIANGPSVTGSGIDAGSQKITHVAAGTEETDAVNFSQLKSISETVDKGWNLAASGANTSKVAAGATVDLKNTDGNLTISKTSDSNDVVFNLSKDFKVDGVTAGTTVVNNDGVQVGSDVALGKTGLTIANGPSVTGSGIDAGGKVISHVAAGEVSATSTEAVNGSQLSAVQAQANQPMTFTGNEGSVARTLGQTLAISGESSTAGSYSGANLKSVVDAATGTLHLQLAESPQFGKVQINDGGKISGVAPGTAETDVPNMGQLKSISESVDKGWNLTAAGANTSKVVSGATVDLKNTDGNLTISKTSDSNDVVFNLSKDFKVDGVTAGTTVVNNDGVQVGSDVALGKTGLTIANGPSVTGSGIDAGGKVISHVAAGEVSATSTEAVNGSQLSAVQAQANQPMTFTGNEGSVARTLGQTLAISGESSTAGSYSGANLKSVVDAATGTLHLQLAESPQFGKVQINDGGKISGVAPGTAETDVPNMGQLKSISESVDKGWNLTAAGANTSKVVSGATVDLKNTDGNLTISKTSDSNDVVFNLSKDFKVDGVTAGTTVVNNDGVQVGSDVALGKTGLTIANGPSVTGSGIDAGGKVISHVAAGEVSATSTEAVNGSQLSAVQAQANQPMTFAGNEGSVARTLGQTLAISGESSTAGSYSGANLKSVVDAATGTLHLQLAESPQFGKVQINDGGKISGVAPGTAETDVPNMGQLKSISESVDKGWNLTAAGANTSKVVSGATVDLKNTDGNLTISKTSDSNDVVFNLSKDFKVDGVTAGTTVVNNDGVQVGSDVALGKTGLTIANGPSVTGSGIDAGGKVISHVAAGEVSATSTEAVNGSQLSAVQAQANQPMTFTGNEGSVARTLGQTLAISGESSTAGSYSGANLKSVVDAATGTLHLQLAESPQFGKVQINDGGKISGVAPGTAETDVPNMGQLKSISESVDKGWNLTAAGANTSKVVSGATVDLKNTDGNLTISKTSDSNDVVFNLSKDLKENSVTVGSTVVNDDGVKVGTGLSLDSTGLVITGRSSSSSIKTLADGESTVTRTIVNGDGVKIGDAVVLNAVGLEIVGGPSITLTGIDAGSQKITHVAAGTEETDAVNFSQLKSISESVGKGWNLTVSGANASKVAAGATVDLKNTDGNLTISKSSDSNDVVFNLSKDFKVDGVTAGNTVMNNDGVKVGSDVALGLTGLVIMGGPSVTNTGINAGNQKIINVAAAMADTDAVNFAQLKHAVANVSVKPAHYYSTNDGGTPGGNYDGDGATGIGSVAAGVGTQASGEGAVVVGAGAMGSGKGSVAMGRNASASADGSVVLGTGAKDGGRGAENYIGKYSGVENKTVGTVSLGDATKGETRTISNVADAKEATDAVNLRQLDYVAQQVNHYTDDKMQGLSDIQNVFKINNSKSSSSKGIALNAMAIGTDATASGVDGVAMGNNANVSANNAVAIGANSVADRPNTVSMGSAGSQRQVTNVAPATTETDAVNLGQLNQGVITAKQYTDGMVGNLRRDGNGGVAAAIATANLPQAYVPGRGMASLGVSSYQGQSAIAVGVSAVSDSGHWVFKFSGTTNTRSQAGVGAGVGYQW
ncbi:YadA-like family protein [Xylella taiwanensis]|uniref:YadA-like family protein n=1 Tax=Xylella taiwanensis TaxID=1444770 RepID=UPI001E62D0CF|nr:YadA-like family protein [Xylella taiwanensis]UFN05717.1 YadA-like family protein [Xylella taiwanensis]